MRISGTERDNGKVAPWTAGLTRAHSRPTVPHVAGSIGRFEILRELAILTSEILVSERTMLIEKRRRRFVQSRR